MSETPRTHAQIFPCTMRGAYCDIYNCRTQAKYIIGRPDGPLNPERALKLCDEHARQVVDSIPPELKPKQIKKTVKKQPDSVNKNETGGEKG